MRNDISGTLRCSNYQWLSVSDYQTVATTRPNPTPLTSEPELQAVWPCQCFVHISRTLLALERLEEVRQVEHITGTHHNCCWNP